MIRLMDILNEVLLMEAIPLQLAKKYTAIERNPAITQRLLGMFDKLEKLPGAKTSKFKQRLYLPFAAEIPDVESSVRNEVEDALKDTKYKLDSYIKATVKDANGRTISLQKILNRLKRTDLVNKVNDDTARKGAYQFQSDLILVFSHAKLDLASMSTGRGWTSCMNLITGINRQYVARDIQQGSFICYLTTKSDTNLNTPTARTLIKPYINIKDSSDIVYITETSDKYGTPPPNFIKTVQKIISDLQNISPGDYELTQGLYCDRLDKELVIHTPQVQAIIDGDTEPKTKEEVSQVMGALLPQVMDTRYTINDDLSVDVNADVNLGFQALKVIPIKFGKVNGGFWCHGNELTTLKNSPREVTYSFDCSNNELTSLEGGPEIVGLHYDFSYNRIKTLKGAPKDRVRGAFRGSENPLRTLEGSPRNVNGIFDVSRCQLTSLKGSPTLVGHHFYAANNKLVSAKDGPETIFGNYSLEHNQIEGPSGFDGITKNIMGKLFIRGNILDSYPGAWKDTVDKLQKETDAREIIAMYS